MSTRRKLAGNTKVAVLGAFAPIDENFAGIEVDIADLDVDELAHAYSRIEEQFEQDLVLHVAAALDGSEDFRSASATLQL